MYILMNTNTLYFYSQTFNIYAGINSLNFSAPLDVLSHELQMKLKNEGGRERVEG